MFPLLSARTNCGVLGALICFQTSLATPIINEVMYHPAGVPENTGREFIEIHNPDDTAAVVTGYRFDQGVAFTFPAATIPARGFLVVAANLAAFQAAYPGVTNVVGGWTGSLSNSEEDIQLVDASGLEVDSVPYATEGDWALRVREPQFQGWDWETLADGGGRSLELINPVLGNNNGQNWGVSNANGGTPGQANSIASINTAPLIKDVKHRPAVPTSSDPIKISCDIEDEVAGSATATLFWRISSASPPSFTSIAMTGDGTGGFSAILQPQADQTIIEFYVQASDGARTRSWPAATNEGLNANALLQVDNEVPPAGQVIHRLILTVLENSQFQATSSNREFNVTLVSNLGSGETIRYRSGMRVRGASSRGHNPRPMRMSVPNDDKLEGRSVFNLHPKFSYLQYLAYKIFQAARLRAPDALPVEVRRNSINDINASGTDYAYGRWAMVEHLDGDFIDRHWPLDSGGNLYKKVRPDTSWAYRNGNLSQYANDGWTKETNASANDWSDLDTLMGTMNANPSGVDYLPNIELIADINQWMKWFAVETLIANGETNASNGADDDYSMYRGLLNPKFQFIPHDLDTTFGHGDGSAIFDPNHTLFDMTERGDRLEPLIPFFAVPSIRQRYFTALRDLAATLFDPAVFNPFVDNHLGGWVDPGRIDQIKSFTAARRTFVLNSVTPEVGNYVPVTPTTLGSLDAPRTVPVVINEVLARNVAAYQVDGLFSDAIELRNYGITVVDLSGMSLTDDPLLKDKFVFPLGSTLASGAHRVLLAATSPGGGATGTYLNFSLNQQGDGVYFYDTVANNQALVDSIEFGPQAADFSIGRTGATGGTWRLGTPTLGAANNTQSTGAAGPLKLNEWLSNPDFRVDEDFLEIYNPQSLPVSLGGLIITDDFINYPARHTLPALSFIGPQAFTLFFPKGNAGSVDNPSELPFKLSSFGGWAAIFGNNGALIDRVDMDAQFRDVSRGRTPDGGATLADFSVPTPGLSNTAPPASLLQLMNQLRITEINYNPPGDPTNGNDFEFIELKNIGATSLTITGVRFTNGIDFTFPSATLAPGAYTVLVRNLARFQQRYGTNRPVGGVFTGAIDNSGEILSLKLPNPWDVNILSFRYERDWHPSTDGGGYTLEIASATEVEPRNWGDRDSWQAGSLLHGTPGLSSPPVITSSLTASGTVGNPFDYAITATNEPTSYSASGLPGGLIVNVGTGQISGTPTQSGTFNVTLGAANGSGAGTKLLALVIAPQPAPVITSPLNVGGALGSLFSYQITASNQPSSFTATGRPAWLDFNSSSGLLSGTPTAAGNFNVAIGALNAAGADTKTLVIQIIADVIAGAVDSNALTFTRGGGSNWFSQTAKTHDGIDAAQSGDIGDGQSTWIEAAVAGPRQLTFWWSVSSELNWDYLRFRLDGTTLVEISGEIGWQLRQFDIPSGNHILRWAYEKDTVFESGSDTGWLDQVTLNDPDSDGDGLSDIWENTYFGNLARDGSGDFDNDGQIDRSEFAAGTSPASGQSHFAISNVEARPNDEFLVTWMSVAGRAYQLQASPDLQTWVDTGPVVAAAGAEASTVTALPNSSTADITLVAETAPARALIPTAADTSTLWRGGNEAAFAAAGGDSSWLSGPLGVGYETQPGSATSYAPFIGLDVSGAFGGPSPGVFVRIPFNLDNPSAISGLTLRMRLDDGFVAWINGQRISSTRFSTTADPTWDSGSIGTVNDESLALSFLPFATPPPPYTFFRSGGNILAIQVMSNQSSSSDLLTQPILTAQRTLTFSGERVFWRVKVLP
ncbi:MAG: lamin tail domain-containing protein [Verrucomicrobiales bacterium]